MKEDFKRFVKANPRLIDYVKDNNVSWQSLYEVYALYGEDEKIWEKYISDKTKSIDELLKMIKNINLDSIKNTVDGLQKAITLIQGLTISKSNSNEDYVKSMKYEDLDD